MIQFPDDISKKCLQKSFIEQGYERIGGRSNLL